MINRALVSLITVGSLLLATTAAQGQEMALIPGGEFEMGDHHDDMWLVHPVCVDPFYMDLHEVTNQQYAAALNWALTQKPPLIYVADADVVYGAGGTTPYCQTNSGYSRILWEANNFTVTRGKENHPMVEVSWYGAAAYANWRSAQHGRELCYDWTTWDCDFSRNGYRLPTEAEWEYAARGGEHDPYYRYPWGNELEGWNANYSGSGDAYETEDAPTRTTPVGYYNGAQMPSGETWSDMVNGYGLYDMAGNAFDWCNDWFDPDYYKYSPHENPHGPDKGTYRVARGGAWSLTDWYLRCAHRRADSPGYLHHVLAFRLVLRDVGGCPADFDNNGEVGPFDLAILLGDWGPCP